MQSNSEKVYVAIFGFPNFCEGIVYLSGDLDVLLVSPIPRKQGKQGALPWSHSNGVCVASVPQSQLSACSRPHTSDDVYRVA